MLVIILLSEGGALEQGLVSGSCSTQQFSKCWVEERIQLLQWVIFCLQISYCVCNWIRIKRSKGCRLGIRLWNCTPVKSGWRAVAAGGWQGSIEGMEGRGPTWSWKPGHCSPFSLAPPSLVFLRYRGSAAWKASLRITHPWLTVSFSCAGTRRLCCRNLKVSSCLTSTHPLLLLTAHCCFQQSTFKAKETPLEKGHWKLCQGSRNARS